MLSSMRVKQVLLAAAVLVLVWASSSWVFYGATVHKGRGVVARRHQALHDGRKEAARSRAADATDGAAAAPTFVTAVLHEADVGGAVALGRSIQRVYAGRARQVCVRADTLLAYATRDRRDADVDVDASLRGSGWSRVQRLTAAALFGTRRVVAGAEVAASAALLRAAALGPSVGGEGEARTEAVWVYLSPDSVVLRALTPRQLAAAALDPRVLLGDERRLTQPLSRRILRAFLSGEKSALQTAEKAEEAAEAKEDEEGSARSDKKKKKRKQAKRNKNKKTKEGRRLGKGRGAKALSNAAGGEDLFARLFDDEAPAVFAVGREPSDLRGGGGGGGTWGLVSGLSTVGGSGLSTVGGSGADAAVEPRRVAASAQDRYGGAEAVPCIDGGFLMFRPSAALRERATAAVWQLLGDGAAAATGSPLRPPLVFCRELSGCAAQHLLSSLLEPLVWAAAFSDGDASVLLLPRAVAAPRAPAARLRLPAAHGGGGEGIETAPPQRAAAAARNKGTSQESLSLALRFDEVKPWDDVEGFVHGGLRKARPLSDGAAAAAAADEEEEGMQAGGHAARALEAVDRGVVYGRPYELWWRLRSGGNGSGAAAAGAGLVLRGGAFGESCDAACGGAQLRCDAAAFAALGAEAAGCGAQVALWGAGGCPGGCEAAVHATLAALPELGGWPRGGGGKKKRRKTSRSGSPFPAYAGDVGVCYANTLSDPRMAPACGASHPRLRRVCACVREAAGGGIRGDGSDTRRLDFGVDDFPVPSRAELDEMFRGM